MSQQQAVQPIVLKQENGEVVLKLVLESPNQETQTLILQNPRSQNQAVIEEKPKQEKLFLDLNHSTDTTAIAAFDYATGIALFLAACATWLAYWFGVRSFHLTKQSFDALVLEIKDKQRYEDSKDLRILSAEYLQRISALKSIFEEYEYEYKSSPSREVYDNKKITDYYAVNLKMTIKELDVKFYQITLYFSKEDKQEEKVVVAHSIINHLVNKCVRDLENWKKLRNPSEIIRELEEYEPLIVKKWTKELGAKNFTKIKGESDMNSIITLLKLEILNDFKDILNK